MSSAVLRKGLLSVTFRKLGVPRIVELASAARLEAIEWGGDIHCPPGDHAAAKSARDLTAAAGLATSAYGSYYRLGETGTTSPPKSAVLDTAAELGAPLVRVWAGTSASGTITPQARDRVVQDLADTCDAAADRGLDIALEYHRDTLTDSPESAVDLIRAVDRKNLFTYWQPRHGLSVPQHLSDLAMLRPWLRNVHVFHWSADAAIRHPLRDGFGRWQTFLTDIASDGRPHTCSLEFVKDDRVEQLQEDAATFHELVDAVR